MGTAPTGNVRQTLRRKRHRYPVLPFAPNNETVKAETGFEMMAFDRTGKLIMAPRSANREAQYREHYLLWAGPFVSHEKLNQGDGLLVNFSDVDGSKANYNNDAAPVERSFPMGKN